MIANILAILLWPLWRDAERSAVDQNAASTLCRWPASKTPLRGRKFASTRVMP